MENILVMGGTGAIGRYIVPILAERYNVYVTSRSPNISRGNINYIRGNAHDMAFLQDVLKMRKYSAIVDFMNYTTNEYLSRYELLLNSTEQLFFISSSRVYSNILAKIKETDLRLLDSNTDLEYLKTDDYALAKARQENLLRAHLKKNWTIIRPYMTYSQTRLDLGMYPKEMWLYRVLRGRTVLFPEDVASHYVTLTSGKDVAYGIVSLIGRDDAMGKTFHITHPKAYTWKEIIEIYEEELSSKGYPLRVKWIKSPFSNEGYIYYHDRLYDRVFDNTNISKFIDVTNFTDAKFGIRECVAKFLERPSFLRIDWKKQAFWDRKTKEHAAKNEFATRKDYLVYMAFRYCLPYKFLQKMNRIIRNCLKM